MSSYRFLYPLITPYVPGCAELMVQQHIARVVRDFCHETKAWIHVCDSILLDEDESTYELTLPGGAEVVMVQSLKHKEHSLEPMTDRQMEREYVDWETERCAIPDYYSLEMGGRLRVWPTPGPSLEQRLLRARISLKPSLAMTGLPDTDLLEEYGEIISNGVLGNLMAVPNREWADPNAAEFYRTSYQSQRDKAVVRERDNRAYVRRRVSYGGI